ncbi:hypothetical protein BU25DRAFT_452987 [Macroventuria anomochaeta]|uniref:Uncharacterized protein n=1 Tax=Macroventuria anomochaeta TaxID=301207 RepID=A0ACB6SGU5_9PLEO|nr:uncharacterized protein BU25DRAFT_452987 [Macroventuria anomochaeta]KAF2633182.1 hypothetical protein BU25DRAFT_452987 [Macroventuria anomochaeta]
MAPYAALIDAESANVRPCDADVFAFGVRLGDTPKHHSERPTTGRKDSVNGMKGSWEDIALKWLDTICTHQSAYFALASKPNPKSYHKHVGRIIANATIELVRKDAKYEDNQLFIAKCERDAILEWLANNNNISSSVNMHDLFDPDKETTNFTGTSSPSLSPSSPPTSKS